MYSTIRDPNSNVSYNIKTLKGSKILGNYLDKVGGAEALVQISDEQKQYLIAQYESEPAYTFWVSCHGVYEDAETFIVPEGCKLIFTTSLTKLGEGQNYQENAIFRDLQEKKPIPFIEELRAKRKPIVIDKEGTVLPELLTMDESWGRTPHTLFSHRITYNGGDICPNLHMIFDDDCFREGFYLIPIPKSINYYIRDKVVTGSDDKTAKVINN